jgi:hypothetical protein
MVATADYLVARPSNCPWALTFSMIAMCRVFGWDGSSPSYQVGYYNGTGTTSVTTAGYPWPLFRYNWARLKFKRWNFLN